MGIGLKELQARTSVRLYDADKVIPQSMVDSLKAEATMINTHTFGLKFVPYFEDDGPFSKFTQSYGMFKGVRNYFVCVIDTSSPDVEERAGFFGEQLVLKCQSLGLGSCFVGGTYDREAVDVQLRAGEKVLFLITFGYSSTRLKPGLTGRLIMGLTHKNRKPGDYYYDSRRSTLSLEEASEKYPYLRAGLEAIGCAPSALAKRPMRLWVDEDMRLRASVPDMKGYNSIDMGIAKYNFCIAAGQDTGEWTWGNDGVYERF